MNPLRTILPGAVSRAVSDPVDEATIGSARRIVDEVRSGGEDALRRFALRYDSLPADEPLLLRREDLEVAAASLSPCQRGVLERTAARIRAFAEAQRASLRPFDLPIPGGIASQELVPVSVAGCYVPGGRHPLPSTALMTVVTARAAGVGTVIVASPRPSPITLAAAAVAGADAVLCAGGAHAIAALAHGIAVPAAAVVVGPGNRWVTAAKQIVSASIGIDMLAGPSELTVLADETADPSTVAADLLAQAEHDVDALPILVTTSAALIDAVNAALTSQLADLPTRETAQAALSDGFAVLCETLEEAASVVNELAPEHLEVVVRDPQSLRPLLKNFGGGFWGLASAEVLGDYGAGPNHTLPTGGRARYTGGLSVFHFLRIRTSITVTDMAAARELVDDAIALARLEGLEAHARAAERRR